MNAQGWKVVGTGDINRDGQTDLFFQLPSGQFAGLMGYWLMNGNRQIGGAVITNALGQACYAAGWRVVGSADFNGDNMPDLLFQEISTGDLALWFMNGGLLVQPTYLSSPNPGVGWKAVACGDFDRDGHADILLQFDMPDDDLDSAMLVWYMNGATRQNTQWLYPYYPNGTQKGDALWRVAGLADFNSDWVSDNLDIVCQHQTSRALRKITMNGIVQSGTVDMNIATSDFDLVSPR